MADALIASGPAVTARMRKTVQPWVGPHWHGQGCGGSKTALPVGETLWVGPVRGDTLWVVDGHRDGWDSCR